MTPKVVRKYQETHPWLSFQPLDLRRAPPKLWMQLGEARSKIDHLLGVPLRPEATLELMHVYLAKGAWATTAIEGNTLSEDQVRARVAGKLELPPSQEYLGQEIDNVVAAFNLIAAGLLAKGHEPLTTSTITDFNRLVLNGLMLEDGAAAGMLRTGSVAVGPYKAAPAEDVAYLLSRLCEWLNEAFDAPDPDLATAYSIVKAIVAHVYFEWIHPFGDGNGRTGRLIEFQILLAAGVPFPAAHLLSNHYNLTRPQYYRQLHHASQTGGDLIPFLSYALQGLVDGLRATIQVVQDEQIRVMWENHVHRQVPGSTVTAERQRTLVLALTEAGAPIKKAHLMTFTPEVAQAYRGRSSKTLTRDVNVLRKLQLIRSGKDGFEARTESIRAFLPNRVERSIDPDTSQ